MPSKYFKTKEDRAREQEAKAEAERKRLLEEARLAAIAEEKQKRDREKHYQQFAQIKPALVDLAADYLIANELPQDIEVSGDADFRIDFARDQGYTDTGFVITPHPASRTIVVGYHSRWRNKSQAEEIALAIRNNFRFQCKVDDRSRLDPPIYSDDFSTP